MARTSQIDLPLIQPAQAQKHVTVNQALERLDAAAQLRVATSALADPPAVAAEGESYIVSVGASGEWQDRGGQIAVRNHGGWMFLVPRPGWRAWDEEASRSQLFDGADWIPDAAAIGASGSATRMIVVEFDHDLDAGPVNATAVRIPAPAQVIGVTGRVVAAIGGSGVTGWRIGVEGADNRYGSGLGLGVNSYLVGLSGNPVTYYSKTPLRLAAEGGSFASGRIRLAMHLVRLEPPRPV